MAAVTAAAVSLRAATASTSPSSAPQHSHCSFPSAARSIVSRRIRAQAVSTDATAAAPVKENKVSKKQDDGVVTNKFRPKEPYVGKCLLNTKITVDDAPGETWHMVFSTEGEVSYKEGQSISVVADGEDKNGKPHKLRLYSIASSVLGDMGDSKTIDRGKENELTCVCVEGRSANHLEEVANEVFNVRERVAFKCSTTLWLKESL